MNTVRAQNLQDLIYKRGQAGVTKASVTIVFDNRDKANSPIGFDDYAQISVTRQIVLGGASKYLINGHRAQQTTVQNLFQSVGLNINNPNFLIMQGRITKVLNMKNVEILAMIEEAAGTRMFEDRKEKSNRIMAKKEVKVQEIEALLREEIEPKLEKLRAEKRAWLDYQKTQGDLERLTRVVVAADHVRATEKVKIVGEELESKKRRVQEIEVQAVKLNREIENLAEDLQRVRAVRDKELKKGGKFQALEEKVKEHSHELVRLSTQLDLERTSVADEEKRQSSLVKNVRDSEAALQEKRAAYERLQGQYNDAKVQLDELNREVEQKEELLSTLQTGVASREGQESGYQGHLHNARNRATAASTEQEQARLKISHLETQIQTDEPKAKKAREQNSQQLRELERLQHHAQQLETQLIKAGFDPCREQQLHQQETSLQQSIRALREQANRLGRKVAGMDFTFTDPESGFDRSRVKGLVAQLFSLSPDKAQAGTALEVCAGGRLYHVVVDTAETGTQLLQNGKLRKRVTIIPLNKISTFKTSAQKIGAAQQMAPGKVDIALSLIGHDAEVSAAMDYVFGSTLICQDAETAKKVTFDPAVRTKSVTLEGDVYDPSGTLSGGSSPNTSGVLVTLGQLNQVTKQIQLQENELKQLQDVMKKEKEKLKAMKAAKQELDLKQHEIQLTQQQINESSSSSVIQAVEGLKTQIEQLKHAMADAKVRQLEAEQDAHRIEKDISELNDNRDSKLHELEKSLDGLKTRLSKKSTAVKTTQKELQHARVESEQAEGDLMVSREQLAEAGSTSENQRGKVDNLLKQQSSVKAEHERALAKLKDEQAKLSGFDEELSELESAKGKKSNQLAEESLEAQKLRHGVEKATKESMAAQQLVASLEKEHDWIAENRGQFGKSGSAYDFQGKNVSECRATLKTVTERWQGMKKKINPKVMAMIDSVEKKEASLKTMMRTVIRDKKKIEETIATLDEYKREALVKTWKKVTVDFGHIFSDLLPGNNTAKLVPADGGDERNIQKGLEVKVCLGKVWKQSLIELSGGQRYV